MQVFFAHTFDGESLGASCANPLSIDVRLLFEKVMVFKLLHTDLMMVSTIF